MRHVATTSDDAAAREGRRIDVIACPTGGPDVAHQIINTGTTDMHYLALSNIVEIEACEYPDSQKVLIAADHDGQKRLRKVIRAESTVDYYDREPTSVKTTD